MTVEMIFRIICVAAVLVMVIYYVRRKRRILSLLTGAITGFAALVLINKYGGLAGISISLNTFNISGSTVLGVPFVIGLVLINSL